MVIRETSSYWLVFFVMAKLKSFSNSRQNYLILVNNLPKPSVSLTASTAVLSTFSSSSTAAFLPFVRPVPLEFQRCHLVGVGGWGEWVVEEGGKKVEQRRGAGLFVCNWVFGRNK